MKPPKGVPADAYENLAVIGTSSGRVKLVDLAKNKILTQFLINANSNDDAIIFACDWNKDGLLAIGSTNWSFNVLRYEPDKVKFADFAQIET